MQHSRRVSAGAALHTPPQHTCGRWSAVVVAVVVLCTRWRAGWAGRCKGSTYPSIIHTHVSESPCCLPVICPVCRLSCPAARPRLVAAPLFCRQVALQGPLRSGIQPGQQLAHTIHWSSSATAVSHQMGIRSMLRQPQQCQGCRGARSLPHLCWSMRTGHHDQQHSCGSKQSSAAVAGTNQENARQSLHGRGCISSSDEQQQRHAWAQQHAARIPRQQ